MLRGWAPAMQGSRRGREIEQGWAVHQLSVPRCFQSHSASLAVALGRWRAEVGLDVLAEAVRSSHDGGVLREAEVYRLQAELPLLLPRPRVPEEEAGAPGVDVADSQQAKTSEPRRTEPEPPVAAPGQGRRGHSRRPPSTVGSRRASRRPTAGGHGAARRPAVNAAAQGQGG